MPTEVCSGETKKAAEGEGSTVDADRRIGRREGITTRRAAALTYPAGHPQTIHICAPSGYRLRAGRTARTSNSPCAASEIPKPPSIASSASPRPHPFSANASGRPIARVTFTARWKLEVVATSVEA